MSDHEIMGSSQRGERGDSDADVPFLYFGVWFLASFEQGVAAQCSDDFTSSAKQSASPNHIAH